MYFLVAFSPRMVYNALQASGSGPIGRALVFGGEYDQPDKITK